MFLVSTECMFIKLAEGIIAYYHCHILATKTFFMISYCIFILLLFDLLIIFHNCCVNLIVKNVHPSCLFLSYKTKIYGNSKMWNRETSYYQLFGWEIKKWLFAFIFKKCIGLNEGLKNISFWKCSLSLSFSIYAEKQFLKVLSCY